MGVPNLTRTDARRRAELLDVTAYEVELDLTDGGGKPGERTFRSRTTVRFRAKRVGAGTFVDLVAAISQANVAHADALVGAEDPRIAERGAERRGTGEVASRHVMHF